MSSPDATPSCAVDPDGHARRVLEYEKVLAAVADWARTPGGRQRVLALLPVSEPERVLAEQETVAEVRRALDEGTAPWPLDAAEDARELLREARLPRALLEPAALGRIATTLESAGRLRDALQAQAERCPRVRERAAGLGDHAALVAAVRAVVDERGEMRENASPLLRRLRREIQEQRELLLARLEAVMRAAGASPDQYVTQRADRYVIPVRADSAASVRGIVHDRSGSGATLFVEPLEVLDANNELQRRRDAESREVRRILEELTARVAVEAPAAEASLDAVEAVDAVQARALWARALDAAAPSSGARLRLRAARHPLLEAQLRAQGGASVPLDLALGDARVLVLTGPNAGGKTVALKSIGLLALLHQAGVPIPAAPDTELPVFARIFADIGDEQSIEAAESTFSSHLRHVVELVRVAGPRTLALLDEFMAGTDPEEGAALAQVVLRRLAARGCTTFVTTHLAALKLFAHTEPGLVNAGMAFDPESRSPLYRLQPGVPGSSNAISTAARLGLDPDLLDAARDARGEAAGRLEVALDALEAERARLATARLEAAAAETEARRIREEYAVLHAQVTAKRRTATADARREAEDLVAGAKARIEAAVRELRAAQASPESIRAAHATIRELEDRLVPEPAAPAAAPAAAGPPQTGDRVWVRPLGREGILEETEPGGRARVRFGNVTVMVAAADLHAAGPALAPATTPPEPRHGGYTAPETPAVSSRLDLRGQERVPALQALETFLDRMVLQGTSVAEIVHGKGTGVLRRAVQEYLARHADVAEFRLGGHGEGGSGVTIAKLRSS